MDIPIEYFEKDGRIVIVWPDGTTQDTSSLPCGVSFVPENVLKIEEAKNESLRKIQA